MNTKVLESHLLPCLTKKYTGFECMGCGIQRSLLLVLDGEFIAAFYMYPAIYTLMALFGNIILSLFFHYKFSNRITNVLLVVNAIIIITNYILKFTH